MLRCSQGAITGKWAPCHRTDPPCKQTVFVGAQGTLAVGRAEPREEFPFGEAAHTL